MLTIYNTLTRKKEQFIPPAGAIKLFVCGPTVYDYIHAGNARTYIFFDFFVTYLRSLGYEVDYLQNITDIDDKILTRAREENRDALMVAREYEERYHETEKLLGISAVSQYGRATDAIPEIISQIERLIDHGHAYAADGNVYFSVASFPSYGTLSHQDTSKLDDAEPADQAPGKRSPHDFTLWKAHKEGEPHWESPWGDGRPGWHIEDTALAEKYLGAQYDIHGGGLDIIFPHHEAEIAQAESVSGKTPYVRYWMHTGLLTIRGEKMSKSLKNFTTAKELLDTYPAAVIRTAMLSSLYRSPLDFSPSLFAQAQESRSRLRECISRLQNYSHTDSAATELVAHAKKEYDTALADDLNTPVALAALFSLVRELNKKMDAGEEIDTRAVLSFFESVNALFGIELFVKEAVPPEIEELARARNEAKQAKDFTKADEIRSEIKKRGFEITDTKTGHSLKKIV